GPPDDPTRGSIVSTLNDVCWIRAKRPARANIVAILYCLAVILLELVQRRDRNVTRFAIVICILRYGAPCHRQTNVHIAALRRPMPPTNECTYSSAPTRERSSTVLGPLGPRCAAGSIPGAAPARWPECRIRAALCS